MKYILFILISICLTGCGVQYQKYTVNQLYDGNVPNLPNNDITKQTNPNIPKFTVDEPENKIDPDFKYSDNNLNEESITELKKQFNRNQ